MMNPKQQIRIGILASHPVQYQAPWFRALATRADLMVFFAYRPDPDSQGEGFGKAFTWDVDLLSGYPHEFLNNIANEPGATRYNGCDTPEIGRRITEERFDIFIVSGWYLKCYWQAIRACRKHSIPVMVRGDSQLATPRSSVKKWIKEVVYRKMLERFDGFLTVGERNSQYLRHYGVQETRLFPAPHFIDSVWFAEMASVMAWKRPMLRRDWGAETQDFVVVFVGKFVPKKRPFDVISAFAQLDSPVKCCLVLIGAGELEESLRSQAKSLGIKPFFAGFKNQSELPLCYSAADVVVLPSDGGETWGLVINEAMACGTPCVVSESCGCVPDLIEEEVTGFAYPVGDVDGLTNCLMKIIELKTIGHDWKADLERKMRSYSVDACADGTIDAASKLLREQLKIV